MLRLFRSYHPAAIIWLLLYAMLLRVVLIVAPVEFEIPRHVNILGSVFYSAAEHFVASQLWIFHLLALIIIFFQALYFNALVNFYKLLPQSSYLPAFSFLLVSSLFLEFTLCTPALLANTFLLVSFSKICSSYKKEEALGKLFDAGLMIAVASMFFFPYIIFILFVFASLIVLRSFNLREYILVLLGLVVPYYLAGVYFYWQGQLPEFLSTLRITELRFNSHVLEQSRRIVVEAIIIALVTFWSVVYQQANIFKMVVQARLIMVVLVLFFSAGVLSMFVQFNGELFHFIWLSVPVGFALAVFFSAVKRRGIAEIVHFVLLLTILFFQYFYLFKFTL